MKRNKFFLLFLLSLFVQPLLAFQITGSISLENETNHSGIKVLYSASSVTAQTDSTITNSDGEYSLNAPGGIYNVTLYKDGFWIKSINQVLISKDEYFNHGELKTKVGIKEINAYVNDTFYADTHYVVVADLALRRTDQLYIEPGTQISFKSGLNFWVDGELIAHGTADKKITFDLYSGEQNEWKGLSVDRDSLDFEISNVQIEFAENGISVNSAEYFHISESSIIRSKYSSINLGVIDSALIEQCVFSYSKNLSIEGRSLSEKIRIEHNQFEYITGRCIQGRQNMEIRYNIFSNNYQGIYYQPGIVEHNLFLYNETAMKVYTGNITNNTFFSNELAFARKYLFNKDFQMNCFSQNEVAIDFGADEINGNKFAYNFFEYDSKFLGKVPLGMGVSVSKNNNGDDIDSYLNVIDTTAEFYTTFTPNPHAFYPKKESPLVDAGDPTLNDPDGSIRDIGAFPYNKFVGISEKKYGLEMVKPYPNPFQQVLHFEIPSQTSFEFVLFDAQGKIVYQIEGVSGPLYSFENSNLKEGIYFYRFASQKDSYSGQIIKTNAR